MAVLVAGLLIFLGLHSLSIVAPAWRDARQRQFGEAGWKGLYSLVAAIGLLLIVYGYGLARQAPLLIYQPPAALRPLAWALMLPVFVLLFATYLPGRIRTATRHPMLLATQLWAGAHLLVNGTLADLLLFGGFLAWAVVDRISVGRRPHRDVAQRGGGRFNDLIAVGGGLAVYALFFSALHRWLTGVAPA